MKPHHAKRLLKLADFLQTLPPQKFDFRVVLRESGKPMPEALKAGKHACGTVGCAIGWCPAVFPKLVKWAKDDGMVNRYVQYPKGENIEGTEDFFGITFADAQTLFLPGDSGLPGTATPKQVAQHIRRFVASHAKAAV